MRVDKTPIACVSRPWPAQTACSAAPTRTWEGVGCITIEDVVEEDIELEPELSDDGEPKPEVEVESMEVVVIVDNSEEPSVEIVVVNVAVVYAIGPLGPPELDTFSDPLVLLAVAAATEAQLMLLTL
jgi:hypothetical protein